MLQAFLDDLGFKGLEIAELTVVHAKRILNFRPYLRFRVFSLAPYTPNQTLFDVLFIATRARHN